MIKTATAWMIMDKGRRFHLYTCARIASWAWDKYKREHMLDDDPAVIKQLKREGFKAVKVSITTTREV